MEIARISGGIEYRPELMTLVLPGDRDYRVRTVQTSNVVAVETAGVSGRNTEPIVTGVMSGIDSKTANESALAFLKYLGDLETAGVYRELTGLTVRDEYAGGHRGIVDLWV